MLTFSNNDRILVLAPHPDDETIGTGGILQEAVRKGLPVKVVYFTNGDNNEVSFIVYEKRLVFRKREFIRMGEVRRKEAAEAMELLGLGKKQLIFLGYPDFGTMHIFKEHWGNGTPFKSMLTRVTGVPYPECLSPGAPYIGESILRDIKTILVNFMPTKIFSPHPADINVDHRSLFLFLQVALWDLEEKGACPQIYPYLVHALHWPRPRGFYPELGQTPPPALTGSNVQSIEFNLTKDQINKKKEMVSCYRSQVEYNPLFLYCFARKNELFLNYPVILLKEHEGQEIDWDNLGESFSTPGHAFSEINKEGRQIRTLSFAKKNDFLHIRLNLHRLITKERGIDIYLFGYKKDTPFAKMPKIHLHIGWRGRMVIYKNRNPFLLKEAGFYLEREGKEITIQFPLSGLDYPDYILSSARGHARDLALEATAWRPLVLLSGHDK